MLSGLIAITVSIAVLSQLWRRGNQPTDSSRGKITALLLGLPPCLLLWLWCYQTMRPERTGLLALSQVLAPYLSLPVLGLLPVALLRRMRIVVFSLVACAVLAGLHFVPLRSQAIPPVAPSARQITVMNWNISGSNHAQEQAARVLPVLGTKPAEIVALEETNWRWVEQDPLLAKLYPYRVVHTRNVGINLMLLSSYPLLEQGVGEVPRGVRGWQRFLWARLDLGSGQQVVVVVAHAHSPRTFDEACKLSVCYETKQRDALFPHIRRVVDVALARGDHLLLAGDMNLTEREPAYAELSRGLHDAWKQAGTGLGLTWGMQGERSWRWPLLRIDYLFSSPNVVPISTEVDCKLRGSDHCIVSGRFALQ